MLTMAATNVARAMKLETELQDILRKFKSYKKGEEPLQLTRIELVISALTIFRKLYESYREKHTVSEEMKN